MRDARNQRRPPPGEVVNGHRNPTLDAFLPKRKKAQSPEARGAAPGCPPPAAACPDPCLGAPLLPPACTHGARLLAAGLPRALTPPPIAPQVAAYYARERVACVHHPLPTGAAPPPEQ